jgi:hypothetical protein
MARSRFGTVGKPSWLRKRGRRFVLGWMICSAFVLFPTLAGASIPAPPLYSGGPASNAPILVILCNWGSGFSYHPNSLAYYKNLWTTPTGGGWHSLPDYWHQVSFGQTTLTGSKVLNGPHSSGGWYSMRGGSRPITPVTYANYGGGGSPKRIDRLFACMNAASKDITASALNTYQSILTVTPYVQAVAPGAIKNGDRIIKLSSTSGWPTASFDINYTPPGAGRNFTNVKVSSINFATKTLKLASPWSLGAVAAGAQITSVTSDDVGWVGPQKIWENAGVFNNSSSGTAYHIGIADVSAGDPKHGTITNGVGDGAHEVGHSFGYQHSRAMTSSVTDYYDCWDQMSYNTCGQRYPSTEAGPGDSVVGLDAIDLILQGWIPNAAQFSYAGGQHTINLHALSDPNVLNANAVPFLVAKFPGVVTIEDAAPKGVFNPSVPPRCKGTGYHCDSSDYFTIEYRQAFSPTGTETWDYGVGNVKFVGKRSPDAGAVVIHLHTAPANPGGGHSFLANTNLNASKFTPLPNDGGLAPWFGKAADDEFVDTKTHTFIAVNAIDPATWTATITLSSTKIGNAMTYTGPTTVTYGQKVALSAQVTVAGSGAPVPNVPVGLAAADGLGCSAHTNLLGIAVCDIVINDGPETGNPSYDATGQFNGDAVYGGIYMASHTFNINDAPLTVTAKNKSRPSGTANPPLQATLSGFVLGQTLATSGVTGSASCKTTATTSSPPGKYPITCTVGTLKASHYSFAKFVAGTLTVT